MPSGTPSPALEMRVMCLQTRQLLLLAWGTLLASGTGPPRAWTSARGRRLAWEAATHPAGPPPWDLGPPSPHPALACPPLQPWTDLSALHPALMVIHHPAPRFAFCAWVTERDVIASSFNFKGCVPLDVAVSERTGMQCALEDSAWNASRSYSLNMT